jgi:hypothetical protein
MLLTAQEGSGDSTVITLEPAEAQAPGSDAGAPASTPEAALSAAPMNIATPAPTPNPDAGKLDAVLRNQEAAQGKLDQALRAQDAASAKLDALSQEVKAMRQEMNSRFDALSGITTKLRSVESAYLESDALGAWKFLDTAAFTKVIASGFAKGEGKVGTWAVGKDGKSLSQKDGKAFFAKYRIPVAQPKNKRVLYSFKAGSSSKDTVGLGIHFFVSDMASKAKEKSYWGEGKSILVWFAKDPKVKENRASYLQIYKSESQTNLERVFDSKMEDGFTDMDDMKVDILYDANENFILIQVNDMIRVAYKLPFSLPEGKEVAFRTVGSGCGFEDFTASTEN